MIALSLGEMNTSRLSLASSRLTATRKCLRPPVLYLFCLVLLTGDGSSTEGVEILSKSRLESCVKASDSDHLDCSKKVVVDLAVPSGTVRSYSQHCGREVQKPSAIERLG